MWAYYAVLISVLTTAIVSLKTEDKLLIEEYPDRVIFRTRLCQPISSDVLQSILGSDYDHTRMASTLDHAKQLTRRRRRSLLPAKAADPPRTDGTGSEGDAAGENWFLRRLQHRAASEQLSPPWECKMAYRTRQNGIGMFPQFIVDGQCLTKKCFYDLYQCDPVKYSMKILKKDVNRCNPMPVFSNSTVYEERWTIVTQHVTVACNCVSSYRHRSPLHRNMVRKGG
ncbi:chromatin modification-related protein EAF7 [Biomphalaria pfeifferi]|uniref:Chromatin modification-related protein EAF7 n=1 Tax=Biomphalaria pfeifferi TaxID=112525 RepID=A0AAD8AS90_BIOPF|nr:chromatin modification-related protein EAF7 [Biomphalaria pfeifferi]